MNYIFKMRTFKQYLAERKLMMGAALAGTLLGGTAALIKKQTENLPVQQSPSLTVTPRATNANQATTTVTTTEQPTTQATKTQYTPSHPVVGSLLNAFSQAEHRGTGVVDYRIHNPKHAIRTKAGEGTSSAWGVFQITGSTARDFVTRKPHLFDDETKKYALKFADIGKQMLNAPKNHPTLGLGRPTPLANPNEHHLYLKMSDAILRGMMDDMKIKWKDGIDDRELPKITKRFRGEDEKVYLDTVKLHMR